MHEDFAVCDESSTVLFEVKSNSDVILNRDIIQHGNVDAVEAAACWLK